MAKPVSLDRLREVLALWFPSHAAAATEATLPIDTDKLRELTNGGPAVERRIVEQLRATNDADAEAMTQALARWRHPEHDVVPPMGFIA